MEMPPDDNADPSQPQPRGDSAEVLPAETTESPDAAPRAAHRPSPDEALAEMRRSLREEQAPEERGFRAVTGWLKRLFSGKKQPQLESTPPETTVLDELEIPAAPPALELHPPVAPAPEARHEEPSQKESPRPSESTPVAPQVDLEVGSLSRTRYSEDVEPKAEPEPPAPPHSILSTIREEGEGSEEDAASLRQQALQDYVITPEEPEEEANPSLPHRFRRSWRYMRPLEKRLLIGAALIVGLAVIVGSGFLVRQALPGPTPRATPTLSTLPFPISVSLPGGWVFPLRTGFVQSGTWNPTGPEWLQGTEICRWVSLPWTVQLEAVIRTLRADDEIRLSMSNYDSLVYKVKSVEQVPSGQVGDLSTNTPSLLLILSKDGAGTRWVVTAKP
jgi:hypothetical protein